MKYDRFKILTQYHSVIRPRHPHITDARSLLRVIRQIQTLLKNAVHQQKLAISNTWYYPFPFTLHPFNLSPRDSSLLEPVKFLKSPPAIFFPSHKGSRLPTVILSLKNTGIPIGQGIERARKFRTSTIRSGGMNILGGSLKVATQRVDIRGKFPSVKKDNTVLEVNNIGLKIAYKCFWREIK